MHHFMPFETVRHATFPMDLTWRTKRFSGTSVPKMGSFWNRLDCERCVSSCALAAWEFPKMGSFGNFLYLRDPGLQRGANRPSAGRPLFLVSARLLMSPIFPFSPPSVASFYNMGVNSTVVPDFFQFGNDILPQRRKGGQRHQIAFHYHTHSIAKAREHQVLRMVRDIFR